MVARLRELAGAFALLTRLPMGWLIAATPLNFGRCVWAYPVAGAVVGGIGAATRALAVWVGMAPALAACWALAAMVLASGALHEDGLADTADGFGGGATKEARLRIMRDSRIGSYGALALVLSLAIRGSAIATLRDPAMALVVAGALSRGGIVAVLQVLPPARTDGMAAALGAPYRTEGVVGIGLALLVPALLLPQAAALLAIAAAIVAVAAVAFIARARIGGHTGDVLGAVAVVTDCVVLTALAT